MIPIIFIFTIKYLPRIFFMQESKTHLLLTFLKANGHLCISNCLYRLVIGNNKIIIFLPSSECASTLYCVKWRWNISKHLYWHHVTSLCPVTVLLYEQCLLMEYAFYLKQWSNTCTYTVWKLKMLCLASVVKLRHLNRIFCLSNTCVCLMSSLLTIAVKSNERHISWCKRYQVSRQVQVFVYCLVFLLNVK